MWVESCPSPGVAAGAPETRANPSTVRGPRSGRQSRGVGALGWSFDGLLPGTPESPKIKRGW